MRSRVYFKKPSARSDERQEPEKEKECWMSVSFLKVVASGRGAEGAP
jgi:hypothetical protein